MSWSCVEGFEQAGRAASVPEDDPAAVEHAVAGEGDQAGQGLPSSSPNRGNRCGSGIQVDTRRMVPARIIRTMATRVRPDDRHTTGGQHPGMERSIAISKPLIGSERLYSSIVSTAPGDRTRIHHHGDCETSIYIPAGEAHVEANASATEPLVVVLTRNCPDSHVVYLDGGPDGADDVPAPC